ncbi:MAG TPA: PAS domain S-box protein, partial [Polyangiaceae bacterium]|nr:PAS domain S-box protein [Polyangiaceae bacterium]
MTSAILAPVSQHPEEDGRLRQLVDTSQDAVIFIDTRGYILLANPAAYRIFGYDSPELENQDVRLLMAEPYASQHQGYVEHYQRTGERRAIGRTRDVVARRKNGQEFPIELSVTELADDGDDGPRYGAFIRDVSDKVRLQSELRERERMATVGTTASMLVHEIGNPLNNMSLQLETLRRRVMRADPAESAIEKVDACLEEIQRLNRLVQEFRALSTRKRLSRQRVRIASLLEAAIGSVAPLGPRVTWLREFDDAGVELLIDPDKLRQVLLNLGINAVEAMPDGGTLILRCRVLADECWIEFQDTGPGVAPDLAVFEPFVTNKPGGTGLGLAICAEIVREHGGQIDCQTAPEGGALFRVRLPLPPTR